MRETEIGCAGFDVIGFGVLCSRGHPGHAERDIAGFKVDGERERAEMKCVGAVVDVDEAVADQGHACLKIEELIDG